MSRPGNSRGTALCAGVQTHDMASAIKGRNKINPKHFAANDDFIYDAMLNAQNRVCYPLAKMCYTGKQNHTPQNHISNEVNMYILGLVGIFAGAIILLLSIIKYYRSLLTQQQESHSQKVFSRWTYTLCLVLMLFFMIGYVAMGVVYITRGSLTTSDLLIAAIFFFGAVFVYVVITVQSQMAKTIYRQTDELIKTLVNAMEAKDQYTRGHSVHVANIAALFYDHLPESIKKKVDPTQLADAAILHDIGKIGISDAILNKPGALTEEEMAVIRTHPRMGKQILSQTSFADLGNTILAHHERIDQNGYYRMPADQIPLQSKIIAIADTFSALYSDRVYRPRRSYDDAMAEIRRVAGTQLDAQLVEVFTSISEEELNNATRDLFILEEPGPFKREKLAAGAHSTSG